MDCKVGLAWGNHLKSLSNKSLGVMSFIGNKVASGLVRKEMRSIWLSFMYNNKEEQSALLTPTKSALSLA